MQKLVTLMIISLILFLSCSASQSGAIRKQEFNPEANEGDKVIHKELLKYLETQNYIFYDIIESKRQVVSGEMIYLTMKLLNKSTGEFEIREIKLLVKLWESDDNKVKVISFENAQENYESSNLLNATHNEKMKEIMQKIKEIVKEELESRNILQNSNFEILESNTEIVSGINQHLKVKVGESVYKIIVNIQPWNMKSNVISFEKI